MSLGLLLCAALSATAFDQVFDRGVTAYEAQSFPEAIEAFEQLIEQDVVDEAVFFNLGNAYYRNGQLAPAIANYERAWQIEPGAEGVLENLNRAVGQTERVLARPRPPAWQESLFFWHMGLSAGEVLTIALIAWALGWLLLGVRAVRRWPYLRAAATAALGIALLFGASWWIKAHPVQLAVAADARVPVRYGNRVEETVRFELYEGDRVRVEQRRGGWARIRTSDGERGWTEEDQLHFVGPPYTPYAAHRRDTFSPTALSAIGYTR